MDVIVYCNNERCIYEHEGECQRTHIYLDGVGICLNKTYRLDGKEGGDGRGDKLGRIPPKEAEAQEGSGAV